MIELTYTTVDRIFAKFSRDLKNTEIDETSVIEWIGEALEFMKVYSSQEQVVKFLEIVDYHADIPKGFQMMLQVARKNQNIVDDSEAVCNESVEQNDDCYNCNNDTITYDNWVSSYEYTNNYTPVRLANHTLFNSLVCKEKINLYLDCKDEYTIVGNDCKKIRTSFDYGTIAISYLRTALDKETGYPLIPDNISYITAITYYIKWKIAEWHEWNGRQGYSQIVQDSERKWLKYCKQGTNNLKMPKSIDDYQDLLEQSHSMIPNQKKYYGFFGNN